MGLRRDRLVTGTYLRAGRILIGWKLVPAIVTLVFQALSDPVKLERLEC